MASIAIIDQHKIIFPMEHNKIGLEKQICPLCHGHVVHSLKVNNPKTDKNQLQVL